MKELRIRYTVTLGQFQTLERIFDMFRYSGDVVVDRLSEQPFSFVMEHTVHYESAEHLKRKMKFFQDHILGRWGSFGCKISGVKELK